MSGPKPFRFRDAVRLTRPTGVSAATLREFRHAVESADPSVLHHHLRETLLRFTFTQPEYPNDFAIWAALALEDRHMAERLAVLDPFHERDLEVLRVRVLDVIEQAYAELSGRLPVPEGEEFFFSSSVAVEIGLGLEACDLAEFVTALEVVPATSIYHHLYEGRVRNPDGLDDFSRWLTDLGLFDLAQRLDDLDIYLLSLENCRRAALDLLGERV